MSDLSIRDARPEDAGRLVEIYSYYVMNTAVSFEYTAPSVDEFRERIRNTMTKFPYIVCMKGDRIVGYAYVGAYSAREAYSWTVTTSIYVDKDCRRQGIGSFLYRELESRVQALGIVNLLAGVAYTNTEDEYLTHDSYKFHIREGYREVAHLDTVGKKFDRWYDLVWMQKKLQ